MQVATATTISWRTFSFGTVNHLLETNKNGMEVINFHFS